MAEEQRLLDISEHIDKATMIISIQMDSAVNKTVVDIQTLISQKNFWWSQESI